MNLFYSPSVSANENFLGEEESRHCMRVLRLGKGDTIHLTNGRGNLYQCVISDTDQKRCRVEVVSVRKEYMKRPFRLHIGIAPTKNNDRFEWFLEKATEIGIDEITPLLCAHSERNRIKQERMNKVLVAAMKQSLKAYLPLLHEAEEFSTFIKKDFSGQKFIASCETEREADLPKQYKKGETAIILIGPEGDFSPEEIILAKKNQFIPISLGESRLRTETAGIVACHTINLLYSLK